MQSTKATVREYMAASKRVAKKALKSRQSARAFLVKAGILNKNGKGLAKEYR